MGAQVASLISFGLVEILITRCQNDGVFACAVALAFIVGSNKLIRSFDISLFSNSILVREW